MLPCCSERSQWGGCRHGFQSGSWWSGAARRWQQTLGPEPWQLSLCFQTSPRPRRQGCLCHEVGLVQWWGRGVFGWQCPSLSGAVLSAYPMRDEASVVSFIWCIKYIEFKQLHKSTCKSINFLQVKWPKLNIVSPQRPAFHFIFKYGQEFTKIIRIKDFFWIHTSPGTH